jgi:hypothetical protein
MDWGSGVDFPEGRCAEVMLKEMGATGFIDTSLETFDGGSGLRIPINRAPSLW